MTLVLLLFLLQGVPTVGDTVWIERPVPEPGAAAVRPQPWILGELAQQLGPADLVRRDAGLVVRYALVFWYPGSHRVEVPGPVLVRRDGRSDTLPPYSVTVEVASVLPAGTPRSRLAPRPARAPIEQTEHTLFPLVLLALGAGTPLAVAAVRWRRRGKPEPPGSARRAGGTGPPDADTLRRWAAAGEYRAALLAWGHLLSRAAERQGTLSGLAEVQPVLDAIAFGNFAPRSAADLARLCGEAERWYASHGGA